MTGFYLNMTGYILNITGSVLKVTGFAQNEHKRGSQKMNEKMLNENNISFAKVDKGYCGAVKPFSTISGKFSVSLY